MFLAALPSNHVDFSAEPWLPSPKAGEFFEAWTSRASKELALGAKRLRRQEGYWRVGSLAKSAKDSVVAALFGYGLSAAGLWRMIKKSGGASIADGSAMLESFGNMAAPWDFFQNAKIMRQANKASDLSICKGGPLPTILLPGHIDRPLLNFTALVSGIFLGTFAAPLGWGGFVAAQGALRARGIAIAAEAFDSAAKLMSEANTDGVDEFGRQEMAMAGWARACRAARALGANSGPAMMAALECRALSFKGNSLGAIPDRDAGWLAWSDKEARSSQERESFKLEMRAGGSESTLASSAAAIHGNYSDAHSGSSDARAFLESLATWWRDMGASLAQFAPKIDSLVDGAVRGWIGQKDDQLANRHVGIEAQDEMLRDGKKIAGWANELRKLGAEQQWPAEMWGKISSALVVKAVQIEAPMSFAFEEDDGEDASEKKRMETALSVVRMAGESLGEQAFAMGMDARAFASAIVNGVRLSRWSKVVEAWGIAREWDGLADSAVEIAAGFLADQERAILASTSPEPRGSKTLRRSL